MKKNNLFSALKRISSILLAVVVMMLSGCSKRTAVDFSALVKVDFSGVDGSGYANVRFDSEGLYKMLDEVDEWSVDTFAKSVKIGEVENNGSISNGDTVTLHISTDEQAAKKGKISVVNADLSFVVEGLKQGVTKPQDLTDEVFDKMDKAARAQLNRHIQKLISDEVIPWGEVSREDIAKAVTNSSSIGTGIKITIPSVTDVEFRSAYTYTKKSMDHSNSAEYFTIMLYSAEAAYLAHRDANAFQKEFDQSGSGNYVFAVYMKSPIISSDGGIVCDETSVRFGDVLEENVLEAVNEDFNFGNEPDDKFTREKAR